jgi:hypothetical protein
MFPLCGDAQRNESRPGTLRLRALVGSRRESAMKAFSILNPVSAIVVLGLVAVSSVAAVAAASGFDLGGRNARPLTIRQTFAPQPAYGADDEDCVLRTSRSVLESGQIVVTKRTVCADLD